jgi:SAM-dependent methyltransferase
LKAPSLRVCQQKSLSQRGQYEKGGIGQRFRIFRDDRVFSLIENCSRVIDLGCGEGITLEELLKRFPDKKCLGIDLSMEHLKTCKLYSLPVVRGDVRHLSLKGESADCCLLMDVIEHLDQPEKALEEAFNVLKPGGSLVLLFPNDRMFFLSRLIVFKFKEAFYDPGHVKRWNPKEMRGLLEKKGFKISRHMNLPFFFWPISLYHLIQAHKR